jgi:hypothetical protein
VDTGFWIFGKKRMIPAGAITDMDLDNRTVRVNLTKDQIKAAPDYEAAQRDDTDYRDRLSDHYGAPREPRFSRPRARRSARRGSG